MRWRRPFPQSLRETPEEAAHPLPLASDPYGPTSVGQAADRNFLLGCIFCGRVLHHWQNDGIIARVPVGCDLPVLAVPGVDTTGARAFVIGAGHLDRLHL